MKLWGYPRWAKGYLQKDGTRSFQLSLSMALCDVSSQRTVEKLDVSKSFVSSCPSPTLFLPVPLDHHHHQLAQWLSPAFFGLDLCIHRDVPHRFHIVIGPTNSIETWSQMPMQMIPWINMMNTSLCHKILLAIVDVHKWEFASAPCESSNACVSVYASCHVIGSFSQVQVCTPDKIRRCLSANFRCSWAIGGGDASNTSTLHL